MQKYPLLSVVIPTFARPHFLERAIRSAFFTAPENEVEILVVPNGVDEAWRSVAKNFVMCPEVSWHPITEPNACIARNHGMNLARGKYIRFLDDDDYFLENAYAQLMHLDAKGAHVSQAGINWVDSNDSIIRQQQAHDVSDFLCSLLEPEFFTLLHSFIWLREKRSSFPWNSSLKVGDDLEFALSPVLNEEIQKTVFNIPVGAWVHHEGKRLSTEQNSHSVSKDLASVLLTTARALKKKNRLTIERRRAISSRLWELIHTQFPVAPMQWTRTAFEALEISSDSRPSDPRFSKFPLRSINPVFAEWLLFPHRKLRRYME